MYYRLNTSILADTEFDRRAYELKDLQKAYPEESQAVDLYEEFADWDGTTGFHLPYHPFVDAIAKSILQIQEEKDED
jgi:NAD-dependent DNA ligase